jgi:hypothetical protein
MRSEEKINILPILFGLAILTVVIIAIITTIKLLTSPSPSNIAYLSVGDFVTIKNTTPMKIEVSNPSIAKIIVYNSSCMKILNNGTCEVKEYELFGKLFFPQKYCPILIVEFY